MTDSDQDQNTLFKLFFDIGIKLGNLHDAIREEQKMRKLARRANQPVFYTMTDQATVPGGGGVIVMRLQGPDQGHAWLARNLNVIDVTAGISAAAITGEIYVFVSAADLRGRTNLNQFSGIDIVDVLQEGVGSGTVANPLTAHYSSEQLVARFNEEFYVVISGGTANHQYAATIKVVDYEEAAFAQEWAL